MKNQRRQLNTLTGRLKFTHDIYGYIDNTINIVSFGGGVNSTALIIELIKRKVPIHYIIFADTGDEMPETYDFIPIFEKYLNAHNYVLTTVKHRKNITLYDDCIQRKMIPLISLRWCTDTHKIKPIFKFTRTKLKEHNKEKVNMFIGIASDESHRMRTGKKDWENLVYPLVDWKINREMCKAIITQEGLPAPVKSGCYYCPFRNTKSWQQLLKDHPALYEKSIILEKNSKTYPKATLHTKFTLERIKHNVEKNQTLDTISHDAAADQANCDGFCEVF